MWAVRVWKVEEEEEGEGKKDAAAKQTKLAEAAVGAKVAILRNSGRNGESFRARNRLYRSFF